MNVVKSILLLILLTKLAYAFDTRVEVGGSYDYLAPKGVYGSWKSAFLRIYHKISKNFTPFAEINFFSREIEGEGILGVIGAYKDWTDWLYTYTAISFGSNSVYLPKYRIDHEFNFKTGKEKNIVPSIGFTYIKYHDVHKETIFYPGITYYGDGYILSYKHFFNRSDPGGVNSSSDLFDIEIGYEGKNWTYLNLSFGKEAYMATYLVSPEKIRHYTFYLLLGRRQWINSSFGFFIEGSYFKLKGEYEKYGLLAGFFKDF